MPPDTAFSGLIRTIARLSILAWLFLLAGCSGGESNVASGNRDMILHWGNGTEPQELDPHVVTGVPEHHIIISMLEGLVLKDPKDLSPIPGVAESWQISEDGREYTFHLRHNARWSNGDPVTAQDFAWSWWRALQPELGNQYAYMYYPIKNAEAYATGKLKNFDQVGVKAIDDHTLQVTLENPTPYFLQLLDHYSMFPVHRPTIEKFGAPGERGTGWTRAGNYVGNGAFVLEEWRLNKVVKVRKNPHYWDAKRVQLNGINFYPTENVATEERLFRAGQLHVTASMPRDKIAIYKKENPAALHLQPYLGIYYYRINIKTPHLQDKRVRLALALTVDRDKLVKHVTKGGQIAAYAFTPPNTMGYTADSPLEYNPERARELLAEAGYPGGRGFPVTDILYNTSEGHREIAVAIQQMWKKELGIDIQLNNQDWKVFLDTVTNQDYQISRAAWIGDYVDPNSFLDMWIKDGGNNNTGWHNPEYDRLILREAPRAGSRDERNAIFRRAESILVDELPMIPIYTYNSIHLIHPSVRGLTPNILDYPVFKFISLADNAPKD